MPTTDRKNRPFVIVAFLGSAGKLQSYCLLRTTDSRRWRVPRTGLNWEAFRLTTPCRAQKLRKDAPGNSHLGPLQSRATRRSGKHDLVLRKRLPSPRLMVCMKRGPREFVGLQEGLVPLRLDSMARAFQTLMLQALREKTAGAGVALALARETRPTPRRSSDQRARALGAYSARHDAAAQAALHLRSAASQGR